MHKNNIFNINVNVRNFIFYYIPNVCKFKTECDHKNLNAWTFNAVPTCKGAKVSVLKRYLRTHLFRDFQFRIQTKTKIFDGYIKGPKKCSIMILRMHCILKINRYKPFKTNKHIQLCLLHCLDLLFWLYLIRIGGCSFISIFNRSWWSLFLVCLLKKKKSV